MAIEISMIEGKYHAQVTPPHCEVEWTSDEPMTVDELDARLRQLGCHPTDIGDAFYAADHEWVTRSGQ
jgi:hypothetical protein